MLPFKLQQLLDIIMDKRGLNLKDAMQYLYSSELYNRLSKESSYLWQLSTLNLYDLLKKEKREEKHQQDSSKKILLFLSFCIESYKIHKATSAEEVLFLFNKYGVIEYLTNYFDTLHTQSKEYIMEEIDRFIKKRERGL